MENKFRLNWPIFVEEARARRRALKLSQKELSLLANVSTPTLSRFENEEKDIQLSSILKILEQLGMIDKRRLIFTEHKPFFDPNCEVIFFEARDQDNNKIKCGITREFLEDTFNASYKDLMKQFTKNLSTIHHLIQKKYLNNEWQPDGSILLTS